MIHLFHSYVWGEIETEIVGMTPHIGTHTGKEFFVQRKYQTGACSICNRIKRRDISEAVIAEEYARELGVKIN